MADKKTSEVRRTISPYDLTAADNPGAIIAQPLLKAHTYDEWSCSMKTALLSRKKFGFLDGTISKPSKESPDYEDWLSVNALLVSWIKGSIDPTVKISHRENAKDLWEYLRKRFAVSNGPKNQKIKAELAGCRQNGSTVEDYYGRLTKIWENIDNYRPLRICECGHCLCDLTQKQEKDRENDMVHQFLYGLDEKVFHHVKSIICNRVPLSSLEDAYNMVCQEEDLLQTHNTNDAKTDTMAFSVQTKSKFRSNDREKTNPCKHCNRFGHLSENCFEVVGYPEWWEERPPRSQSQRAGTRGRGRGRTNGTRNVNANAVHTNMDVVQKANRVITDRDRDAVSGLTDEQWNGVLKMLNSTRVSLGATSSETLSGPQYEDSDWSW